MLARKDWALGLIPVIASLAVLGYVVARVNSPGSPGYSAPVMSSGIDSSRQAAQERLDEIRTDLPPRPPEEIQVGRSQLIVLGTVGNVLSKGVIPPYGEPAAPATDTEPQHGVRVVRQALEIERYVKGGGRDRKTLVLQNLSDTAPLLQGRLLLMLVPWTEGTYQTSTWEALSEKAGVVQFANGEAVPEAAGMSLDGYAARLADLVSKQANVGAPVALAVPAPDPGDTVTLSHLLGFDSLKLIRLEVAGNRLPDVNDRARVTELVSVFGQPLKVETAAVSDAAVLPKLTFVLDGGNSWDFAYDPQDGLLIYPAAGLQVQLPKSASVLISAALAAR